MGIGCQMTLWEDHYSSVTIPIEVSGTLAIIAAGSGLIGLQNKTARVSALAQTKSPLHFWNITNEA